MSTEPSREKEKVAAEAWRLLAEFFFKTAHTRTLVLQQFGLTPNEARALGTLASSDENTMGSLAEAWACDASNATWIVDRLERQGLAERRNSPTDRRVKLVVLTKRGAAVSKKLHSRMMEPPAGVEKLNLRDVKALRDSLAKLTEAAGLSTDPIVPLKP